MWLGPVLAAYLTVGAVTTRSTVTRWIRQFYAYKDQERADRAHYSPDAKHWDMPNGVDPHDRTDLVLAALGAICIGIAWPLSSLVLWAVSWLKAPAERERSHVEQLKQDRDDWNRKAYESSGEDSRMVRQIADALDDILKDHNVRETP